MSDEVKENKTRKVLVKGGINEQKPTKERRKISRRKPGQKKVNYYFTMETQDAIVEYQKTDDPKKRERIYVSEILPAFDALVENLINVYGFKAMHESKQDLKAECLEFLYTTVCKFNPEKGSKAFAYFNIVAKNWLTIKSKKNAQKIKQYVSLDNKDSLSQSDLDKIERPFFIENDIIISYEEKKEFLLKFGHFTENDFSVIDKYYSTKENLSFPYIKDKKETFLDLGFSQYDLNLVKQFELIEDLKSFTHRIEMQKFLTNLLENLDNKIVIENEKKVIDAIRHIIENIEELEFLTKRAVLLYIRNITKLSSKQLSLILSSLKKHYKEIKKNKENVD